MVGQPRQVSLDVTEGESAAGLLGVGEQVGGQQLCTLDHAHDTDRRPVNVPTPCPQSAHSCMDLQ
jgi:hypothetical protein